MAYVAPSQFRPDESKPNESKPDERKPECKPDERKPECKPDERKPDGRKHDPDLGSLRILPPELRLQVYSYIISENFKQVFQFEGNYDRLAPRRLCSAPLGILYTSQTTRGEATQSLMSNRSCKITISLETFSANFPVRDALLSYKEHVHLKSISLATCKRLEIIVQIPYPRSAPGLAQVRRNVRHVVALINASGGTLPPLRASLKGEHHKTLDYTYNDYAMLLGPLARLKNVSDGCTISCSSPLTPGFVDPKCLEQCNLIEAAMTDGSDQHSAVIQQQAMVDIKLEVALQRDYDALGHRFDSTKPPEPLGFNRAAKILLAIQALGKLESTARLALPPWTEDLFTLIVRKRGWTILGQELAGRVLGGYADYEYIRWASGHQTARNPFWQ